MNVVSSFFVFVVLFFSFYLSALFPFSLLYQFHKSLYDLIKEKGRYRILRLRTTCPWHTGTYTPLVDDGSEPQDPGQLSSRHMSVYMLLAGWPTRIPRPRTTWHMGTSLWREEYWVRPAMWRCLRQHWGASSLVMEDSTIRGPVSAPISRVQD